jgi:hypothetical protein
VAIPVGKPKLVVEVNHNRPLPHAAMPLQIEERAAMIDHTGIGVADVSHADWAGREAGAAASLAFTIG